MTITALVTYWLNGEPREQEVRATLRNGAIYAPVPLDASGVMIAESVELREDGQMRLLSFLSEQARHVRKGDTLNVSIDLGAT